MVRAFISVRVLAAIVAIAVSAFVIAAPRVLAASIDAPSPTAELTDPAAAELSFEAGKAILKSVRTACCQFHYSHCSDTSGIGCCGSGALVGSPSEFLVIRAGVRPLLRAEAPAAGIEPGAPQRPPRIFIA
jgi:hypothetical protein